MDNVIFKYKIDFEQATSRSGKYLLDLPKGYKTLSFQMQGRDMILWAQVNPEAPMDKVRAKIFGTGHPFEPTPFDRYIGTVQEGHDGRSGFVWHLYLEDAESV